MSKRIDEILSWAAWGYVRNCDGTPYFKADAKQAIREAIERVRPPYPDRASQPEVYHQLKDKVDEWNEAINAVLKELGLDDSVK